MNKIKRLLALVIAVVMCGISTAGAINSSPEKISETTEEVISDGVRLVITTTIYEDTPVTRASSGKKNVVRDYDAYETSSDTYLGTMTIYAIFSYNGSSASVEDYAVTADPASGYTAKKSGSASGNRVKGTCTFSGKYTETITKTVKCDKNGNIS